MNVLFSDLGEYVQELDRDPNAVARGLVRVTQSFRPILHLSVTRVAVVATAKVASSAPDRETIDYDLVRFERHLGDLWGTAQDADVRERAAALITEITAKLEECGFTVLAGEYALAETA